MARGKPFKASLERLVKAGVVRKPVWLDVVGATKPPFEPVIVTRTKAIIYPEDRLRRKYLQQNPEARRIPINLKARTAAERHVADRFVAIQMKLMREKKMSEQNAYKAARDIVSHQGIDSDLMFQDDLYGPLSDSNILNETARLYLASVKDAKRDKKMYNAMLEQLSISSQPET